MVRGAFQEHEYVNDSAPAPFLMETGIIIVLIDVIFLIPENAASSYRRGESKLSSLPSSHWAVADIEEITPLR